MLKGKTAKEILNMSPEELKEYRNSFDPEMFSMDEYEDGEGKGLLNTEIEVDD